MKARELRLGMIPVNGLPVRLSIEGQDFDFKLLHGRDSRRRLYQARLVSRCKNDFVWDWTVGSMATLRRQVQHTLDVGARNGR